MISRFIDRLAAMPLLLLGGTAGATIWIPCEYEIPHQPPAAQSSAPIVHVRHPTKHHAHHHAKGPHGARRALARGMCPVWADELGGPPGFEPAGYWEPIESVATDEGWDAPGDIGGLSGGSGGMSDGSDLLALPLISNAPLIDTSGTPSNTPSSTATPVPELSTWMLMLFGFVAIFKRRKVYV